MKISKLSIAISTALAFSTLAGCGGDSSDDPRPNQVAVPPMTYAEFDGDAMKGTLSYVSISVEAINGTNVSMQGNTLSDQSGNISGLTLVSDPGYSFNSMHKIYVTADAGSTMICDAAMCGDHELGEELTGDVLDGMQLTTMSWVSSSLGTAADGTLEGTFHASVLSTMATQLVEQAIADGRNITAAEAFESAQLEYSSKLLRILGIESSNINVFNLDLVSAENAANFEGVSDTVMQMSLVNATFASFTEEQTQATALIAALNNIALANAGDFDVATALRQAVIDEMTANTVVAELGIVPDEMIDLALPLVEEESASGPVIEFTTQENIQTATLSSRGSISANESEVYVFDNDINTKWLDNTGVPSVDDPSWVQIQFAQAVAVNTLAITSANDADDRDPENFNIQASNDGVTWQTLGMWSGASFTERYELQEFSFINSLAYSYYRINITKNKNDSDLMQIAEIELIGLIYPEQDHTDLDGIASVRGAIGDNENESKIFDNDIETKWLDNTGVPSADNPSWVQVDFAEAKAVGFVAITSANDGEDRDPENFNLQASNDNGTTWITLAEVSGASFTDRFERQLFSIGNTLAYSTYRLNVTKNKGDSDLMQIAEIELIGPEIPAIDHSNAAGVAYSSRGAISANEAESMAFDGDVDTKWLDNTAIPSALEPSWVQIDLAEAATVNKIAMISANDADDRDPENFNLQASKDGVQWITLGQWSGVAFSDRFERQEFSVSNSLGFSYYRVNITKNKGDVDLMQIAEIQLIGPQYSSLNHATDQTGVISARGQISDSESGDKVFDDDLSTKWLDNEAIPTEENPSWVEISLPEGVIVSGIAVTSANDAESRDPENFNLQGSNDGVNWSTMASWSGQAWSDRLERKLLPMGNGRIYSYYRFNVTKNRGDDSLMQIAEIELIGPQIPAP